MAWDIAEELIKRLGDKLDVGGAEIPDVDINGEPAGDLDPVISDGENLH